MIVLLNGPFGIGKTTTAGLLVERLSRTTVYDPEMIGFFLRRAMSPVRGDADYQDLRLWRRATIWGAWIMRRRGHLIVPMALWRRRNFDEISAGLRRVDADLRCIRLTATEQTLRRRIEASGDLGARAWRLNHLSSGLHALNDPHFGIEVSTEGCLPAEVVDAILRILSGDRPARARA